MDSIRNDKNTSWLSCGDKKLSSRLFVGMEQYTSVDLIRNVYLESGLDAYFVTVAFDERHTGIPLENVIAALGRYSPVLISTTSFVHSYEEAVSITLHLRDRLGINIVKLDVRPDINHSVPDNLQTLKAARILTKSGLYVLPMILPDLETAVELQDIGCAAIRIRVGKLRERSGVLNLPQVLSIRSSVDIPCIAEGGIATAADVTTIMQNGFDAVLVNTAIAQAKNPPQMGRAMQYAVEAGRNCYLSM